MLSDVEEAVRATKDERNTHAYRFARWEFTGLDPTPQLATTSLVHGKWALLAETPGASVYDASVKTMAKRLRSEMQRTADANGATLGPGPNNINDASRRTFGQWVHGGWVRPLRTHAMPACLAYSLSHVCLHECAG